MKLSTKMILTTVVVGFAAFALAPVIWPNPEGGADPTPIQLGLLIGASAIDALFFGLGVALILFGYKKFTARTPVKGNAGTAFLALVWIVISWLPHGNFHKVAGDSLNGLIAIEYGFHATVMIAGTYLAYYLLANIHTIAPLSSSENTI